MLVVTVVHTPLDARIHHRQIRSMVQAGWQVTYAAPFTATSTEVGDLIPGITAVDLPRAVGRDRLRAARAARQVVRRQQAGHDLLLLHDPELVVALFGLAHRPPTVLDVHEDLVGSLADRSWIPGLARPVVRIVARALERWTERNLHLLLAERRYADRFRRTHPLVRNLPWAPANGPPAPPRDAVVYVGRISRARGFNEMIGLGERLRAAGGPSVELIGAPDADVAELLRRATERGDVRWHGFLPSDQALRIVDGAIAGLSLLHDLPNYRVSLPTKVVEYLSHGVPVVTTPLPEAVELVERHAAGLVVPFGDVDATLAAVLALRDDPEGRDAMAARGRSAVREGWSWDAEAPRFLTALQGAAR